MPKALDTSTASGRLFAARFLSRYTFDKETGKFYHAEDLPLSEFASERSYIIWKGKFSGKEAGTFGTNRRRTLRSIIDGETYTVSEHRAAFFLHYGYWPRYSVDHINGNPADNRKNNLRDVPQDINARNKKKESRNSSGFPGVFICKDGRKKPYRALVKYNKVTIFRKCFRTMDEAIEARKQFIASHPEMGFSQRHVMGA